MSSRIIHDEESYRAALGMKDGCLVILGESGFEAYLSCPVILIQAGLGAVSLLMHDLEALSWHGHLYEGPLDVVSAAGYEAHMECGEFQVGDLVERGVISTGLWLSPALAEFGITDQVLDVLSGSALRIDTTPGMASCQN